MYAAYNQLQEKLYITEFTEDKDVAPVGVGRASNRMSTKDCKDHWTVKRGTKMMIDN